MKTIHGNPLGLNLVTSVLDGMTKRELVNEALPEELQNCFDYALPQTWLDQFKGKEYERILCQCVWIYPPKPSPYHTFGVCLNLITGDLIE